jgi:DNA-binding NarL/FixJ family response regulator
MKLLRNIGEEAAVQEDVRPQRPRATSVEPSSTASSVANPLTPRETEILGHIASGKTNRQIAQELHLSRSTVKRHLEHILSKLGVSDRTQAAVKRSSWACGLPGGAGRSLRPLDPREFPRSSEIWVT